MAGEIWIRDRDKLRKVINAYEHRGGEWKEISIKDAIRKSQIEYDESKTRLRWVAVLIASAAVIGLIRHFI